MIVTGGGVIALGIALLVAGAVLVAAETHVPNGALGTLGGIALLIGGITAILAFGGTAAIAVPVGVVLGLGAGGWTLVVGRELTRSRARGIRSGSETLGGRVGEVRQWHGGGGQVFVDGALWRARREDITDAGERDEGPFERGDRVVVEYVRGLTLCVRRAEEWELHQ
jgi:membrane-bound serine protease (ClpP class)